MPNFAPLFLIFFFLNYSVLIAQDDSEAKTLFQNTTTINTIDLDFFIVPAHRITQKDGSTALLFNRRGGLSLNDKFAAGGYFSTSMNQIRPQSVMVQVIYMDYWSVGGLAEHTLLTKKIVHVTFPINSGYGGAERDGEVSDVELGIANFFQLGPAALLEVNLQKYARFNI